MDENELKARDFLAKAHKKPRGGFFSSIFSSGSNAVEDTISLYERAANCFKMAHKWKEAGDAFCEAAQLSSSNKSPHDAATHYINAAVAYRKTDPKMAIKCLTRATEIYIEMGRFTTAARHHMTMAEIYEQDLANVDQACQQYEQAADYYKGEESNSSAMKCLLKVAHFAASSGKYEKASKIFEEAGQSAMDNKLLRYGAKEHLTKAVVCDLNYDIIKGCNTLKKYEADYPMFADSRECGLLTKLAEALQSENLEAYTNAVKEYDSISRLEPWMTDMLLKLKKTMADEEDIT